MTKEEWRMYTLGLVTGLAVVQLMLIVCFILDWNVEWIPAIVSILTLTFLFLYRRVYEAL